jgi:hypothetical protein
VVGDDPGHALQLKEDGRSFRDGPFGGKATRVWSSLGRGEIAAKLRPIRATVVTLGWSTVDER